MDEELLEEIRKHSSFYMDKDIKSKEKLEIVLRRLVDDFESKLDGEQENIRILNFISYLQWRKGDREQALEYARKVEEYAEETHDHSLIYFNNKIFFRKEESKPTEYGILLEKAKEIHSCTEKYEKQKTHAIAEIAYCYSRLGPNFHAKAIDMYRDAIRKNKIKNPQWEFGLALALRRQTHIYTMRDPNAFNPDRNIEEVIDILRSITTDSEESELAARAWIELGAIYLNQHNMSTRVNASKECFETAMKLRPQAYFVLQRYGQHLRYVREFEHSRAILEESIEINDTVFARHHLALTMQKIALAGKRSSAPQTTQQSNANKPGNRYKSGEFTHFPRGYSGSRMTLRGHGDKMYGKEDEHSFLPNPTPRDIDNQNRLQLYARNVAQQTVLKRPPDLNRGRGRRPVAVDNFPHKKISTTGIKSPKKIPYLPGNQLLKKAVSHLEKALDMNNEFDVGRYDLGLTFRYLQQPIEALHCFSMITCNRTGHTSEDRMLVINAYEQQALCKMELADMETDDDKKRQMKNDGKQLLWKSLEAASLVIKCIPKLKHECVSFPTLKQLLQNEESPLKEFATLHELVHEYKESLDFYKKLVDLDSTDNNAIRKVVESYVKLNEIDNAIGALSLLQYTKETKAIQREFYLETYLKGAEYSLLKPDQEEARLRFSQAYYLVAPKRECECANECACCDILVLCLAHASQTEDCELSKHLSDALESFLDVDVLVNDRDCLPGHKINEYLESAMKGATYIIAILADGRSSEISDFEIYLMDIIKNHYYKKSLAISFGNENCQFEHSINIDGESCNVFSRPHAETQLVSKVIRKISELSH